MSQADAEATLDLTHDADHIHGIQAQAFPQVGLFVQVRILFACIGFEKLDQGLANHLATGRLGDLRVRHGSPSWLGDLA
jgi:hypothetical protein